MDSAIKAIFKNVNEFPKLGYPGNILVFGLNAYPIYASNDTTVIFAAIEYGNGRIFVASHELYLQKFLKKSSDFQVLWSNIKEWLTNGELIEDDRDILSVVDYESISQIPFNAKILYWLGTQNKSDIFIDEMLNYVYNGGRLLCGVCPWGWLTLSNGKTLEDMALNRFLSTIGVCFTPDYCDLDVNLYSTVSNYSRTSHFGTTIDTVFNNLNDAIYAADFIKKGLLYLPKEHAIQYAIDLEDLLHSCTSFYKPNINNGVTSLMGKSILSILSTVYQCFSLHSHTQIAPYIYDFPGDFTTVNEDILHAIVGIKSKFDEWHCTGYYLPAGIVMNVKVLEGNLNGWSIRIGAHSDELNIKHEFYRFPNIHTKCPLKRYLQLSSCFGGIVYLESPKGSSSINIKLENVVKMPYYDISRPASVNNWLTERSSSGLWAELCGKHISFTVPSSFIRYLKDPMVILKHWDSVIVANHELRGTDPNNTWRERVVFDIQTTSGNIHAGYPIVVPLDLKNNLYNSSMTDLHEVIKSIEIDLLHELGHNMQRKAWTTHENHEVFPNIFALYSLQTTQKFHITFEETLLKFNINPNKLDHLKINEMTYDKLLEQPHIGLLLYIQLIISFGWNPFKILFSEYESCCCINNNNNKLTHDEDFKKLHDWVERFSNIVEFSITPLFHFWNIPIIDKKLKIDNLAPWLPNDRITQMYPERVKFFKQKYGNLVSF